MGELSWTAMEVAGGRFLSFWAILGLAGLVLIFTLPDFEAAAMPSLGGGGGDMRSAIKFLQDMDSYYGQIARPRYAKKWSNSLEAYNSRLRFGKRSGFGLNERNLETMQSYQPQLMGFDRR